MNMLILESLEAPRVNQETGEVIVNMTVTVRRTVRADSPQWALVKTAIELAGLDPRLVFGPFVVPKSGGGHRATVTLGGREYEQEYEAKDADFGALCAAVNAVFAAASGEPIMMAVEAVEQNAAATVHDTTSAPSPVAGEIIEFQAEGGMATIRCSAHK